jgi:hypothetical protein
MDWSRGCDSVLSGHDLGVIMVSTFRRGSLISALIAGGLIALSAPASAQAVDTTPPVWQTPPTASLVVGQQMATDQPCEPGWYDSYLSVTYQWVAVDPQSGLSRYEYALAPQDESDFVNIGRTQKRSATLFQDDNPCGGGGSTGTLRAVNGVGLMAYAYLGGSGLGVVQDNASTGLTYRGIWATSYFTGWSEGTTQKTTRSGASVALATTLTEPTIVGLVMAKGPDRGQAAVYVDGTRRATVNTYSATRQSRILVWRTPLAAGSHTIRLVNLATAGHARIDLDAFVLVPRVAVTF